MPIVDVRPVTPAPAALPAAAARALAEALAPVFGAAPGRLWVRLQALPAEHYAENGSAAGETPQPVFVTVLHADLPPPDVLDTEAAAVAAAVASALGVEADLVHVDYAPAGRGRIAFGGRLLR